MTHKIQFKVIKERLLLLKYLKSYIIAHYNQTSAQREHDKNMSVFGREKLLVIHIFKSTYQSNNMYVYVST